MTHHRLAVLGVAAFIALMSVGSSAVGVMQVGARHYRAVTSASWQLASGHYINQKMPMQIVHPRPDAEMTASARAARAPSGIEWSIPIVVQGGAWPFRYECTTCPAGVTLVETLTYPWEPSEGLGDYGVLKWTSPTAGNHSFTITVTDQDGGATASVSWTLEVIDRENTTYFMFLNASTGSDANSGAFSSPRQTIEGWYGANKADATHVGKQIFYRTGTYSLLDAPVFGGTGQQVDMTDDKPDVHIGYPGETATIDGANTAYLDWESGDGDLAMVNLSFVNPTVTESGLTRKQFIRAAPSAMTRDLIFRNTFTGNDTASANNSNSSAIMYTGGTPTSYHAIVSNTYSNLDEMDLALMYDTEDMVVEGNSVINGYTADEGWGFFFKALSISDVTVRANYGTASIDLPLLYFSQFTATSTDVRDNIEFAYNSWKSTNAETVAAGAGSVGIGQGSGSTGNHYGTFWSYRNCMHNPHISMVGIGLDDRDSSTPGPFNFENDAIDHSGTYTDGFFELNNHANVDPTKTSLRSGTAILDDVTNLLQAGESAYLGTHGCQVQ